jgi:hypothetical protein
MNIRRHIILFKKLIILGMALATIPAQAADKPFIVHEWGTFTSFMGSDGKLQSGLHHEDEALPNFVYGVKNRQNLGINLGGFTFPTGPFDRGCEMTKLGCELGARLVSNQNVGESLPVNLLNSGITQKMETPVIYFYGEPESKATVEIDFPQGIISQYYPKASSFSPSYENIQGIGPSKFKFDVTLKDVDFVGNTPLTFENSIWNPARKVKANTIQIDDENEKFIFYRGVGDFKNNFTVESDGNNQLSLTNLSPEVVPAAFILNSNGIVGAVKVLGSIKSNQKAMIPSLTSDQVLGFEEYVKLAKSLIAKSLIAGGLYADEAEAMVNTWEKSYFHTPGIRVLYVVPRVETERILPLRVTPAANELVRILVGRVEIMTKKEEQELLELFNKNSNFDPEQKLGRFYGPKLRRIMELVEADSTIKVTQKAKILSQISSLLN